MNSKTGRPRKAPEDSLTEIVPIRLTQAERDQCEIAAKRTGRKLTAWIRERAVKAAKHEVKQMAAESGGIQTGA
ncbi:MAG: hypothetical protein B7X10_00225 [Burkholderiales bacterium 21-58-4]|nr:MAG: hypothetical protein B7X10_00225 [Burkholderiales bacterium 21-58-4]